MPVFVRKLLLTTIIFTIFGNNNGEHVKTEVNMFKHEKILFHPVEVERPNPQYAVLLQEQLGGGNGELLNVRSGPECFCHGRNSFTVIQLN